MNMPQLAGRPVAIPVLVSDSKQPSKPERALSIEAELALLKADNASLLAEVAALRTASSLIKVSAKGALSVYGLGRHPVTLYKDQWVKLFVVAPSVKAFMAEHDAVLVNRPQPASAASKD
jgi:hypothetical protein